MAYIYKLIDPQTGEIRYVGKTEKTLRLRLSNHLYDARHSVSRHVHNWIRQLLSFDLLPIIEPLEEVPTEDWEWYETWWIAYGKTQGWRLTNHTNGGEGHSGYKQTEEHKRKRADSRKGNKNSLGYKHTEEFKCSRRGSKHPLVKLGESDVHDIRQMFRDGKKDKEISDIYTVTPACINAIRSGQSWAWLDE